MYDMSVLFQLVRLSDYHTNLITSQSLETTQVGACYLPQIAVLCGAYKEYISGLGRSLQLVQTLHRQRNFVRFLQVLDAVGFQSITY